MFQAPLVKAVQTSPSSDLCGLAFLEDLHGYLHDVPDSVEIHAISRTATHLHSSVVDLLKVFLTKPTNSVHIIACLNVS